MSKLDERLKMIAECIEDLPNCVQEEIDAAKPPTFNVQMPPKGMTINEAFAALNDISNLHIQPPQFRRYSSNEITADPWTIWDGSNFHKGITLPEAVAECLRKRQLINLTPEAAEVDIDALAETVPAVEDKYADQPF